MIYVLAQVHPRPLEIVCASTDAQLQASNVLVIIKNVAKANSTNSLFKQDIKADINNMDKEKS